MRNLMWLLVIAFSLVKHSYAQAPDAPLANQGRLDQLDRLNSGSSIISGFKNSSNSELIMGTIYYEDQWLPGSIVFKDNKEYSGLMVRYNTLDQELEIKYENTIKIAKGYDLKSFSFLNKEFVSLANMSNNTIQFGQVLYSDSISLLKVYSKHLLKSNYNEILDTGRRNPVLLEREEYFYITNNILYSVELDNLPIEKKLARRIIRKNKLRLNSDDSYVRFFKIINRVLVPNE